MEAKVFGQVDEAFLELFKLLEEYAPSWYTERHRDRALSAMQGLRLRVTAGTGTQFHIFKDETDSDPQPVARVRNIDTAISRLEALGTSAPGRYLVVSQVTGNTFCLDVDAHGIVTMRLEKDISVPMSKAR